MAPPSAAQPEGGGASHRALVSTEKLDELLSGGQDLLVVRRRLEARRADLAAITEQLHRWHAGWRLASRPLRKQLAHAPRRLMQSLEAVEPPQVVGERGLEPIEIGLEAGE